MCHSHKAANTFLFDTVAQPINLELQYRPKLNIKLGNKCVTHNYNSGCV